MREEQPPEDAHSLPARTPAAAAASTQRCVPSSHQSSTVCSRAAKRVGRAYGSRARQRFAIATHARHTRRRAFSGAPASPPTIPILHIRLPMHRQHEHPEAADARWARARREVPQDVAHCVRSGYGAWEEKRRGQTGALAKAHPHVCVCVSQGIVTRGSGVMLHSVGDPLPPNYPLLLHPWAGTHPLGSVTRTPPLPRPCVCRRRPPCRLPPASASERPPPPRASDWRLSSSLAGRTGSRGGRDGGSGCG